MVRIGNYLVSTDSEQFMIFPKNARGETIPVRRVNHFLYLRHVAEGSLLTTFKCYLHQRNWCWRDSREAKPVSEREVVREVARMLFPNQAGGNQERARDLLVAMATGVKLDQFASAPILARVAA